MANRRPEGYRPNLPAPQGDVEGAGRTVEEAVERALASIGLDRKDVDVEVIDEGSRGVLGLGAREERGGVRPRSAANPADRVIRTGREVPLPPMDARDRRIVPLTLQGHPAVTTASRDEGDLRRVVVMPRSGTDAAQERQGGPRKGRRPPRG